MDSIESKSQKLKLKTRTYLKSINSQKPDTQKIV